MDQLDQYRQIVRRLIEEYASYKPAYGDIRTEAVVDREHDQPKGAGPTMKQHPASIVHHVENYPRRRAST